MYNETVIRFLAFAGGVALAFWQPAITLAEPMPPGAVAMPIPVYRAEVPVYHPAARPAPAARPVMPNPSLFKAPFELRSHEFAPALQPNPLLAPSRFRYWPGFAFPTYFVYPGSCFGGNGFWGPWGMLATPAVSFGTNTYAAAQQIDPQYGVDIGTLGGVYQGYAAAQPTCTGLGL